MMTLNMAQQGVFGEIVHCEGAYIHDLRGEIFTRMLIGKTGDCSIISRIKEICILLMA